LGWLLIPFTSHPTATAATHNDDDDGADSGDGYYDNCTNDLTNI